MAPPTSTASSNSTPTTDTPRVPPAEQFWQKYSPHHEFPLSGVTSVVLHILVVALLLLAAWVAYKLGWGQEKQPLPVEAVTVEGGGGGNPFGVGNGPGKGATAMPEQETNPQPPDTTHPQPKLNLNEPEVGKVDPLDIPNIKDENGNYEIPHSKEALESLQGIQKDARQKLFGALAGKGKGGPGSGGGEGTGHGTGTGAGVGEGTGKLSQRQKRVLRWSMTFNTQSGEDYLRQLANIRPGTGAILAVPRPDGSYEVIRDLHQRPAKGKIEDISQIHRIFWVDDKPESVAGLARALDIPTPPYIVAFFPEELEQALAKMEHDYRGRAEDQIEETKFTVVPNPDGTYHAQVVWQEPKH